MLGGEVEQLFTCIVCGKSWPSKQSLRAHMKVHKGEGYMRTSVHVRREQWQTFKELCREHKTTTCHVLDVLVKAFNRGAPEGLVDLASPNPVIIQMTEVFLGKPRSKWKMPISLGVIGRIPMCKNMYRAYSLKGLFACTLKGRSVSANECETCPHIRGFAEVR